MTLGIKIKKGYSTDFIVFLNVLEYELNEDKCFITYQDNDQLYDVAIQHVEEVKES